MNNLGWGKDQTLLETKNNSILIRPITVILLLFTLISVQIFVPPQAAIARFEIIITGKPQPGLTKGWLSVCVWHAPSKSFIVIRQTNKTNKTNITKYIIAFVGS